MKITIIGNGYTTNFLAEDALNKGYEVSIITRNIVNPKKNIHYLNFFALLSTKNDLGLSLSRFIQRLNID